MESVKTVIEDTVTTLFSHFNFGKSNTEKMMVYCRPAVEKFLFTRLYPTLISLYEAKYRELDAAFADRQKTLKSLDPSVIFDALEVWAI